MLIFDLTQTSVVCVSIYKILGVKKLWIGFLSTHVYSHFILFFPQISENRNESWKKNLVQVD